MSEQMPLRLRTPNTQTFDNFIIGDNAEIIDLLNQKPLASPIYLWGNHCTGRTHLLQALCHQHQHSRLMYLDLKANRPPENFLQGLATLDWLCLDNIDHLPKNWQEPLFHLFNTLHDNGGKLCVTANCAPMQLSLTLADLKSRLAQGLTLQLKTPNDDIKKCILTQRATQYGLTLSDECAEYMMRYYNRDLSALIQLLDQCNLQSMIKQKKITIPFIKSLQMTTDEIKNPTS